MLSKLSNNNESYRIGITGPPGAGKSTITNQLISYFRKEDLRVAVLLVDPSSPFSKGAFLGDRIRVSSYYKDSNVFVRSLASRGSKGGLSDNISEIADILEAANFDIILYETVGVGQVEIDVVEEVDTVILVLVPESGDDIQMMKAGILEIADIYTINKYDRKDSDKLYIALKNILSISSEDKNNRWEIPIIKTIATTNSGIKELFKSIYMHKNYINSNSVLNKHPKRFKNKIDKLLLEYYKHKFWTKSKINLLEEELNKNVDKQSNPYIFIKKILLKND